MTIFDKIKNIFKGKNLRLAELLSGGYPDYFNFGDDIYKSDTVKQAVNSIVGEIKKLEPTHVKKINNDITIPDDAFLQNILDYPNDTMTSSEFLEKIIWSYMLNYNAFIVPTYDYWVSKGIERRKYISLNPINPREVKFYEYNDRRLVIEFIFDNNKKYQFDYKDVIHLKREFSLNEFMGGDENGEINNKALLETLKLNAELLDGLAKNLKISSKIHGILKVNTMLENEKLKDSREKFENDLKDNESGILATDLKNEYIPIQKNTRIIDSQTLDFIDQKILRSFGVSKEILLGSYTKEQYESFYQKTIEPIAKELSEQFTKVLFTQREKAFGNRIMFFTEQLVFMSVSQKLEMVKELGASGTLYENEKRACLGLKPIKELEGVRMQSLNYVDVKNASLYQVGENDSNNDNNNDDTADDRSKIKNKKIISAKEKKMLDIKKELNARSEKLNNITFENRGYEFEVRTVKSENENEKIIEGRAIVYDSETDIGGYFKEVIDKGALDNTDLKDVRFLVNHNTDELPLARSRNNNKNSSMQLTVDDKGMSVRVKLDMKNPRAVELYSAIERGDVSGMSFMFCVRGEKWDDEDSEYPTRHIIDIAQVLEVSAVTFPAYDDTELNARAKVLDSMKQVLADTKAKSLDSDANELELEKEKFRIKF